MSTIVAQYLQGCRYRGLADSTIDQYAWTLRLLEEHCPTLPRKGVDLLPVVSRPSHGLQGRKDMVKNLKTFFLWCGRRHQWPNPVAELDRLPKRKKLPRVLTELEAQQLAAGALSTGSRAALRQRDLALVLLVLDTGLRLKEVANLRWPDVGPDYLVVRDGKTGDRVVPLSPEVKRVMLGLGDGEHIWMGQKGPLTRHGVQEAYQRVFQRSGFTGPKLGPHLLRHTCGTQYIGSGGNLFSLKGILGHSSVKTTEIYVTLAQRQVRADHARYSPVRTLGLIEKLG